MVRNVTGVVCVADDALAIDDKRAGHLEGVTHRFLDVVALPGGSNAVGYGGRP